MMAHKQLLHELLSEDQEPFRLKTYIADKRSQLNNSSPITALRVKNRSLIAGEASIKRTKSNACFFAFVNSPDVAKSPVFCFQSPARSPGSAVPSKTAAVLVEAAMRINNRQRLRRKNQIKNVGFSLFGSFVRILKHRNNNRILRNCEMRDEAELQEIRDSCNCISHEEFDEMNGGFASREARLCCSPASPFRFSLHKSPSSSGRRTPEFCSPATSPIRNVKQEKEKLANGEDSDTVNGDEEEEKEQCSPVSVLDPFFEDNGHENAETEGEEDDHDLNYSIANIERAGEQLLNRLRRFEQLAALDPVELERRFLESSDDEFQGETKESEDDEGTNTSNIRYNPWKMPSNMKSLVSDLVAKEKIGGWKHSAEEVEAAVDEVERAILGGLVEELSEELCSMDEEHQELTVCQHYAGEYLYDSFVLCLD